MFDTSGPIGRQSGLKSLTSSTNYTASSSNLGLPVVRRGFGSGAVKRALDIVGALVGLLLLLPMLLVLAAAIALDSRGPILFRQCRTGRDGRIFTIYKFRTMTVTENGDNIQHATKNDPRVTRIGRALRSSSLDEVPQLINVLLGQMSLVGPRPHALAHDRQYSALITEYNDRFLVRPGLTGLAQVNGLRGEIRVLDDMRSRVSADVLYAKQWSVLGDLSIIIRTFPHLWKGENAH